MSDAGLIVEGKFSSPGNVGNLQTLQLKDISDTEGVLITITNASGRLSWIMNVRFARRCNPGSP